jgi:hypothetical protein
VVKLGDAPALLGWDLRGTLQMGLNTHLVMWREESLCYLLVVPVALITKFRIQFGVVFELHLSWYPVEFWPKVSLPYYRVGRRLTLGLD